MKQTNDPNCAAACPQCGEPPDRGAYYCGVCGAEIPERPEEFADVVNRAENAPGICPFCSGPIPPDRNYCILCGAKLHDPDGDAEKIERYRTAMKRISRTARDLRQPDTVCAACKAPLDEDASFCGSCGTHTWDRDAFPRREWKDEKLEVCPYCSQIIPSDRRYCIFCGGPLHLPETQREAVRASRAGHVSCAISFRIAELTEHETEMFYLWLYRNRTLSDPFIAERNRTVECTFSVAYDGMAGSFGTGVLARMIRLFLEDAAKAFPKLGAIAYCHYSASCPPDDLGGYVCIELADSVVTVEDTPYL